MFIWTKNIIINNITFKMKISIYYLWRIKESCEMLSLKYTLLQEKTKKKIINYIKYTLQNNMYTTII